MPHQLSLESYAVRLDQESNPEPSRPPEWAICMACGLRQQNPGYACRGCHNTHMRLCPPPGDPIPGHILTLCQNAVAAGARCEWRTYQSYPDPEKTIERYWCGRDGWSNGEIVEEPCPACPWRLQVEQRLTSVLTRQKEH